MGDNSSKRELEKVNNKTNKTSNRNSNLSTLFYRWVIFIFAAVLCTIDIKLDTDGYSILESLALVAVYNGAVTVGILRHGKKHGNTISYFDVVAIALLVLFSGGVHSDLYVFLFFIIGYSGINGDLSASLKVGALATVLYAVVCFYADKFFMQGINYTVIIIRDLLFLMASFAISRLNYEVRRYDEMRKKEFRIARTDKLTGLANRHYFEQKLKDEAEYAIKAGSVLNILMFDIDNFKGFNDRYGHVSGDKLLVLFADIIRQCIRNSDVPVRYGGEEFLIMIRDLDIFLSKSVADRIRRRLEKQHIYIEANNEKRRLTVSCGISQFPKDSTNIKEVIEKADQALYHAKRIGKNIVVSYDEVGLSRELIEKS